MPYWEKNVIRYKFIRKEITSVKKNREGFVKSFVYDGKKFLHVKHLSISTVAVYLCPKHKIACYRYF